MFWRDRPLAECRRVQWLKSPVPQNTSQPPPHAHGPTARHLTISPLQIGGPGPCQYSSVCRRTPHCIFPTSKWLSTTPCAHHSITPLSTTVSTTYSPPSMVPGATVCHGVVGVYTVRHGPRRSILCIYGPGQRIWPAMKRISSPAHTFLHGGCPRCDIHSS